MLASLAERYPAVFGAEVRPLAIGIDVAIAAETGIATHLLGAALHRWTCRDAYLTAIATGTHRYNLDGSQAAELTAETRAYAAARLDALRQRWKAARRS